MGLVHYGLPIWPNYFLCSKLFVEPCYKGDRFDLVIVWNDVEHCQYIDSFLYWTKWCYSAFSSMYLLPRNLSRSVTYLTLLYNILHYHYPITSLTTSTSNHPDCCYCNHTYCSMVLLIYICNTAKFLKYTHNRYPRSGARCVFLRALHSKLSFTLSFYHMQFCFMLDCGMTDTHCIQKSYCIADQFRWGMGCYDFRYLSFCVQYHPRSVLSTSVSGQQYNW